MINLEHAFDILDQNAQLFETETINLDKAPGRILAEDIRADRDYPPFNRASVDGYALSMSDVEKKIAHYRVVETIFAGDYERFRLRSGECYKVMTGAAVPESANVLLRKEDVVENEDVVTVNLVPLKMFLHIALKGEDVKSGDVILKKNKLINAPVMASLAAVGKVEVEVYATPKVVIITTGDEIVEVEEAPEMHQIRNSNAYSLRAFLSNWHIKPHAIKHVRDSADAILRTVNKSLGADIIITTGGVSMGDSDYMPSVFESAKINCLFHKINIKPGKPIWVGKKENGPIIFGLPGNPFSVQATFLILVQHYLNKSFGSAMEVSSNIKLSAERIKTTELNEFFLVQKNRDTNALMPVKNNGSGDITSGITADGISWHPAETDILRAGSMVKFYPFCVR